MIRAAEHRDFDDIHGLLQQLWSEKPLSKSKTQEIFKKLLKRRNTILRVFVIEKRVLGFGYVELQEDFHMQGLTGVLAALVVDKMARNHGIGKKLMKDIISQCKKANCKKLKFISNFRRKSAHKFYESLGFHKAHYLFWKDF